MFHFSKFINLFFYVHSHFERFSQFWNLHAHSILLAYSGSMLYAIPSLLDIYTIDTHSIHFQFCNLMPFQVCSSSAIFLCHSYLSFTHPNFSAIFSLVQCLYNSKFFPTLYSLSVFFHICSILLIQVWLLSHTLVLKLITLTS